MPLLLCLTDPKKREVLLHLSREKKIEFQERIYNQHDVGSSHEPWSCSSQPIYSLRSANVVMQSSAASIPRTGVEGPLHLDCPLVEGCHLELPEAFRHSESRLFCPDFSVDLLSKFGYLAGLFTLAMLTV